MILSQTGKNKVFAGASSNILLQKVFLEKIDKV